MSIQGTIFEGYKEDFKGTRSSYEGGEFPEGNYSRKSSRVFTGNPV